MSASGGRDSDSGQAGWPGSTRRDRLERIAKAERDRRAGRGALALATLGEAAEWPARAVAALVRLEEADAQRARRVLEEGLDRWALELGLGALDAEPAGSQEEAIEPPHAAGSGADDGLDAPLAASELDRAFEEAETRIDEMHDVNQVAARVLMDEPIGLAELSGEGPDASWLQGAEPDASRWDSVADELDASHWDSPADELDASRWDAVADERGAVGLDAADGGAWERAVWDDDAGPDMDAARGPSSRAEAEDSRYRGAAEGADGRPSRAVVRATLERWLGNLQRRRAGRT